MALSFPFIFRLPKPKQKDIRYNQQAIESSMNRHRYRFEFNGYYDQSRPVEWHLLQEGTRSYYKRCEKTIEIRKRMFS